MAKSTDPKRIRTTSDLRDMLIGAISDVRAGVIDASQARTIAALSNTILSSARLDLDVMRLAGNLEQKDGTKIGGLLLSN